MKRKSKGKAPPTREREIKSDRAFLDVEMECGEVISTAITALLGIGVSFAIDIDIDIDIDHFSLTRGSLAQGSGSDTGSGAN